jgi:transposase-like protein
MKCELCSNEMGESFLGKLNGTVIKIIKENKTTFHYVCSDCQKKYKDKVKEQITKNK